MCNKCTVWCQCGNCTHNYSRGTEDAEDLHEVYPKGAQRRSERKTLSRQQGDGRADQYRSRSSWCSGDLRWKLDLLLWPRDQETEFPVDACWLSRSQTEQIPPKAFDDPFFWQHWHDLHAQGFHWTDSQQGMLCWGFKGVQKEIPSEDASTLQIGSVAFPPGQCTSPQLYPCHRLFDQDGYQNLPIVQTLFPVTFGYSLTSKAVVMRQLRRWKRLWRRSLTRSHKRTSMGPWRSWWNGAISALQPEITSKGTRVSCVYYQ